MRKLKLEELEVDSFVTTPAAGARNTVRGYGLTAGDFCTADPNCTMGCTNYSCVGDNGCTDAFGCSHECNSLAVPCSETQTQPCADTCDPYVCSNNVTCPWGYPTCNENCG